jgi:hypothetical protein
MGKGSELVCCRHAVSHEPLVEFERLIVRDVAEVAGIGVPRMHVRA